MSRLPSGKSRAANTTAGRILARKVQELTDNGADLAVFANDVFRAGSPGDRIDACRKYGLEKLTDDMRLAMFNWLSDRGFGKPMQSVDIVIEDDRETTDEDLLAELLRSFDPAELRAAADRLDAARVKASGEETIQ